MARPTVARGGRLGTASAASTERAGPTCCCALSAGPTGVASPVRLRLLRQKRYRVRGQVRSGSGRDGTKFLTPVATFRTVLPPAGTRGSHRSRGVRELPGQPVGLVCVTAERDRLAAPLRASSRRPEAPGTDGCCPLAPCRKRLTIPAPRGIPFPPASARRGRHWRASRISRSLTSGTPGSRGQQPRARQFENSWVAVVTPALASDPLPTRRRGVEPSPGACVVENGSRCQLLSYVGFDN